LRPTIRGYYWCILLARIVAIYHRIEPDGNVTFFHRPFTVRARPEIHLGANGCGRRFDVDIDYIMVVPDDTVIVRCSRGTLSNLDPLYEARYR
jgi:hypothetical protein